MAYIVGTIQDLTEITELNSDLFIVIGNITDKKLYKISADNLMNAVLNLKTISENSSSSSSGDIGIGTSVLDRIIVLESQIQEAITIE